jgi:ribosomal protein L6P/L9E
MLSIPNNRSFRVSNTFFDFFSSFFWDAGFLRLKNPLFSYACAFSFFSKAVPILIQYRGSKLSIWSTFLKKSGQRSFINFFYKILLNTVNDLFYKSFCKVRLSGVGYKINLISGSNTIFLDLGYSHRVSVIVPGSISIFSTSKSKYQIFYLFGLNRNVVKNFYSFLCSLKKFDAYKGKGLHILDTVLQLKKGKKKK